MRILILTNFYPPYELGGQGKSCKQVVDGLIKRGHQISVLTSTHGSGDQTAEEPGIYRRLKLEMDLIPWRNSVQFFTQRKREEETNLATFRNLLEQIQPDLVFIWGMWNLHRSLPFLAEQTLPGRVVYRFAEYWPTLPTQYELYWRAPGRNFLSKIPKKILATIALTMIEDDRVTGSLKFEYCFCVSEGTRQMLVEAGIPVEHARVIYTGLDPALYPKVVHPDLRDQGSLKILYAGRLSPEKGIETLISAMDRLISRSTDRNITLAVAGDGSSDYMASLIALVDQYQLGDRITFLGQIPSARMPDLFPQFDVLVVPSNWPEPFARVVLEGMITGLVVIATPLGGTGEIIRDEYNGLLFKPADSEDLARQIGRILEDPMLYQALSRNGRSTILESFSMDRMLDDIEKFLTEVIGTSIPA